MTIDPINATSKNTPATNTKDASSAQAAATLNYNDFLQLLIAQMKSQDPTSPMDASQQISQLASFSQVEQQINSNSKLDAILSQSNLDVAQSYIGKYVNSGGDKPTAGFIESVKVTTDGLVATLKGGGTVAIGAGVTVSDTAPTTTTPTKS